MAGSCPSWTTECSSSGEILVVDTPSPSCVPPSTGCFVLGEILVAEFLERRPLRGLYVLLVARNPAELLKQRSFLRGSERFWRTGVPVTTPGPL